MIRVRALGSTAKMLGNTVFMFDRRSMPLTAIIRAIYRLGEMEVDYSMFLSDNIIAVNGAALSSGLDKTVLESGDEVTLIPVTHGG